MSDMEVVLRAWLLDSSPSGQWLHYHIGNAFRGETDSLLHADGRYALWSTVTSGRQRREFTGRCDPDDVRAIAELMVRQELWRAKHVAGHQAEDDSEASLEVGDDGRHDRVVLWMSEIRSVPRFERVQEALLCLARRLSGSEILEIGR